MWALRSLRGRLPRPGEGGSHGPEADPTSVWGETVETRTSPKKQDKDGSDAASHMPPLGSPGLPGTEACPGRTRVNHFRADAHLSRLSSGTSGLMGRLPRTEERPQRHILAVLRRCSWSFSPEGGRETLQSSRASGLISPTHMQTAPLGGCRMGARPGPGLGGLVLELGRTGR